MLNLSDGVDILERADNSGGSLPGQSLCQEGEPQDTDANLLAKSAVPDHKVGA